uniref:Uncharacterized protein n=1 Tax=Romanomermis culicivorax TaxID=13658 RepID=A0A915HUX7_ROMCU
MSKNKSRRCPDIRSRNFRSGVQNYRSFSSGDITKWSFLVIMTAALVVTFACISLVPRLWKNSCLLENSNFVQDLFRPLVDCGKICGNLRKINRLKNLPAGGGSIFETEYLSQGRPVVIEDALKNWTALRSFNFEFFVDLYLEGEDKLYVDDGRNCQFFRYRTNFSSLRDALKTLKQNTRLRNDFYIGWRNCDPVISEILKSHYSRPYFLPEYSESTGADWIFMGTKGSGAKLHDPPGVLGIPMQNFGAGWHQ